MKAVVYKTTDKATNEWVKLNAKKKDEANQKVLINSKATSYENFSYKEVNGKFIECAAHEATVYNQDSFDKFKKAIDQLGANKVALTFLRPAVLEAASIYKK